MAIITDKGAFIQIGVTAMRDPKTGDFLPSEPMYILRPAETVSKRTKMSEGEEELLTDVSGIFKTMADKMRQYVEGCGMEDLFSEDAKT